MGCQVQLTIEEYNQILEFFYTDIVVSYCEKHTNIKVVGSTSDLFDPLNYITEKALNKLTPFCNAAYTYKKSHIKKLQIFVSSTYEDLKDERQDVVEAILTAGHIPAVDSEVAIPSKHWRYCIL